MSDFNLIKLSASDYRVDADEACEVISPNLQYIIYFTQRSPPFPLLLTDGTRVL